jgi:hypothetical protein
MLLVTDNSGVAFGPSKKWIILLISSAVFRLKSVSDAWFWAQVMTVDR